MKLIFSNHYEALEAALLDDLTIAPQEPFAPQHIVIPSLAIRRRLELAIANRFGICANLNCGYLAQWLWQQIGTFVSVPEVSPFSPNLLVWRIYRLLSNASLHESKRLLTYCNKADEVMRFELATRITTLFDHYLTYRPEWLTAWSEQKEADIGSIQDSHLQDADWQGALWRQIVGELGLNPFHPAADFFEKTASLSTDDPRCANLPKTAFLFCLPTMPPLYIRLLEKLSRWIDLRLYLLNPCQEYWFEIVDAKRLSYLARHGKKDHHETGNPLLANWGKQTQGQIDLLLSETEAEVVLDDSLFTRNEQPTLLAAVQNAILTMEPLSAITLADDDSSIAIHSCHHLNRQLEVLHDQLLALFNSDTPPTPAEVLVVTPNLRDAAPIIDAVFGTAPSERRIPYTITGRPASQENSVARILLQLLLLPQSRFTASEVFQLLQEPPIARRFDLQAAEQHHVQRWVQQSGIRWGGDEEANRDCPAATPSRHTFAAGLHRLFLGYALPDGDDQVVANRLPCSVGEGSQTEALGRFWLFVDSLRAVRRDLAPCRTADAWRQSILTLLNTFFEPDDTLQEQLKMVRATVADLCTEAAAGNAEQGISLAVFRLALQERLDDPARGGVPSGRLTFAAMSSLRALPYKVICLLGLDDGSYPNTAKPLEFDLMSAAPKRGDLQRKNDERNVFLDLVLAARDRLIITYSGRSIYDNAPLPPSVLVAELLDQILPAIASEQTDAQALAEAKKRLITEHPLQAFSPRYFSNQSRRLFSFNTEYCNAARLGGQANVAAPCAPLDEAEEFAETDIGQAPFFPSPLTQPDAAWRSVSLQQLLRFLTNPCRYLLSERLGIKLAEAEAEAELLDDEPFSLDWEGWRSISDRLLPLMLQDQDQEHILRLAEAGHEFPDGKPGELLRRRELSRLKEFADLVRQETVGISPEPTPFAFDFDLDGEEWRLTGTLTGLRGKASATQYCPSETLQESPPTLIRYRCDNSRAADYLSTWLYHLALCALLPPPVDASSHCISLNGEFRLRPVADARGVLAELLLCYRRGLSQPLHFFPKSAWAYITNSFSLQKARNRWQCSPQTPHGEAADPYYRLALRGEADPLAGDFETLAHTVYGPLLYHLDDSRLERP